MKHDHVALQNARYAIARAREALAPIEIEKELALQALHDENERLGLYEDAYGAQPEPWEKFCDSNCVWTDHHPDCKLAQRTWVGLTDEDLKLLSAEWRIVYGAWMDDFARDIEAKLKEKNT